jgi:uncharacterized protein (TIGR03083 family)
LAEPLELVVNEGEKLLALGREDLSRPVPQYPGWTISDLLTHTGSIVGRTTLICRDRLQERPSSPRIEEGGDPLSWFQGHLADMCDVLSTSAPETPVWGFGPNPNVEFWIRRMLIEVGVHRWDAEQAFGRPIPLLDEVAVAGLEEFPIMWLGYLGEPSTIKLSATDLGRDWVYGPGDPVHAVEGTSSDLYLKLMSRPSPVNLPEEWEAAVGSLTPPPR